MEHLPLGRTGIMVSRLGFGSWYTGSDREFLATLEHALASGITLIDTAESYGQGRAEQLIGRATKHKRDQFVIASKFNHTHSTPRSLRNALEKSLRRLNTDYLDIYYQHWPPRHPSLSKTLAELAKLKQQGKIRAIGVSNWMEPEWQEVEDLSAIDCFQPCYNLLWRSIERRILPLCRQHNVAVIPYSPLCRGLLAQNTNTLTNNQSRAPQITNRCFTEKYQAQLTQTQQLLSQLAKRYQRSPAQVALRWILEQDGIVAPILGASQPNQIDDSLAALQWRLCSTDLQQLDQTSAPLSASLQPHDTLWGWHSRKTK